MISLMDKKPIKLIAELYSVTTTRDGGSKVIFLCGTDSLSAIQAIQNCNAEGDTMFALVAVPFEKDSFDD